MVGRNDTVTSREYFERRWMHSPARRSSAWRWSATPPIDAGNSRQRVFGIGHRLPELTSDINLPDTINDLAATDASFEELHLIREAAMKAHAEVSIRDHIEDSARARSRTQTVFCVPDGVVMVWKTNSPSKRVDGLDQECALGRIEAVCG